jgi:hypothetical protein
MREVISSPPNTTSRPGAQLKKKAQGQLYLYIYLYLRKQGQKTWIGCIWLRIETGDGLL